MKNYLSEMLYAMTSAYSRKDYDNVNRGSPLETNIGKLFSVFAWGLNMVQEQADLILLWDNIDNARGSVLDRYGANFGVQRGYRAYGMDDSQYRLCIKVKILSQLSGGDIDTVLNAASALFEIPIEKIGLTELFPAKIQIDIHDADLSMEKSAMLVGIPSMLKRILAAGIEIILRIYYYYFYFVYIWYENRLTMISDFYPRYNLPYLMYDGTATYNKYKYNGYKTDSFVDLYPTKLSYSIPRLFVYDHIPKIGLHDKAKQQIKNKETKIFYLSETNPKVGIGNRLKIKTTHKGSVPTYQVSLTVGKHLTQYNGKYQYNGTRKYDSKIIHEVL